MNAKITITIPMDKLNKTVSEMLAGVSLQLESTSIEVLEISKDVLKEEDILKQIKNIDEIRKKMTLLDANLDDCYSILNGLVKYKTSQTGQENAKNPS